MEENKTFEVEFSDDSVEDLKQIKVFLTRLFSASVAEKSIAEVFNRCLALGQFPNLGKRDTVMREDAGDLRYIMVKKSRIQYLVGEKMVHIVRIQDARQHPLTF